ncbi:Sensory domain of two-component sensor kinase [Sporobacter termitidis DSM 10068]|uniref:Sensory domain of two-component sensor kinase n=1 Tax=Sporobacter termitidis DSM 10068 TaxID=1123282 RepID=A0A1M5VLH0_9FIRM|nr:cache domain-containing protein [Sporobacter termitidis]SHH76075.1 Sensory domain of two-component sensor kinase [Sporobacter termitidis DSM 10068]
MNRKRPLEAGADNGGTPVKLPFFRRLGFKLAVFTACGILLVGLFTLIYMSTIYRGVVDQINTDRSHMALVTMETVFGDYELRSKKAADVVSSATAVVDAVKGGNKADVLSAVNGVIDTVQLDVDFINVTDARGNVITSTLDSGAGDSAVDKSGIPAALAGQTVTHTGADAQAQLGIRTDTPVKNAQGDVIGVISAGYSLVKPDVVDRLKKMTGNEFTVFIGDTRANTTIIKDGERVVGTTLDPKIADAVLGKKTVYLGQADILGAPYATAYQPILDIDGNAIGVYYLRRPHLGRERADGQVGRHIRGDRAGADRGCDFGTAGFCAAGHIEAGCRHVQGRL